MDKLNLSKKKKVSSSDSSCPTSSFTICPNCNREANLTLISKEIPNFGELLFSTVSCDFCKFKFSDVMSLTAHKPSVFSFNICSDKDFSIKIIRSASATVKFRELEVDIEPGSFSQGYFTNAEGLLARVLESFRIILNSGSLSYKEKEILSSKIDYVDAVLNGKSCLHIEIFDPLGNSNVVGGIVKKRNLSPKEASQYKAGISFLDY